jgi:hypothetical protein
MASIFQLTTGKNKNGILKLSGFFTNLFPAQMSIEYSTKIVSNMIKNPQKQQRTPKFRIKPTIMRTSTGQANLTVRTYSIEFKAQDTREMMTILRENTVPGIFLPIQMKFINKEAFDKTFKYVSQKQDNTWTIVLNYIADGAFFKLEHKIKKFWKQIMSSMIP